MEFVQVTPTHILIFAETAERETALRELISKSFPELEKLRKSLKPDNPKLKTFNAKSTD
ncbi:MAG: hypothetical protein JXB49_14485 [Bacteroidales bacterium]|nr:hypothetical protein [Bacteroidales bacterium]